MAAKFQIDIQRRCRGSFSLALVRRAIAGVLKKEKVSRAALTVLLLGDRSMRRLNKKFLTHDYPTDVLSFDLSNTRASRTAAALEGDLAVSVETARRTARILGISLQEELLRYIIHGILHLRGYEDKTVAQRTKMWDRQELLVKEIMGRNVVS